MARRRFHIEAAIAFFAQADAIAAAAIMPLEAANVAVAEDAAVDVTADEPADDAAVAIIIGIENQHSRTRLPYFVPPPLRGVSSTILTTGRRRR